ncbi:MAG: sugar transferase, partial [Oscillospiraceae bacterium]|nr:sugar transferase [Oscillospiraceae bacterium]
YTPKMRATLLMPAGITNLTSIYYKDEAKFLDKAEDPERVYVEKILPEKMKWNLEGMKKVGFWKDMKVMVLTVFSVCGKKYMGKEVKAQ